MLSASRVAPNSELSAFRSDTPCADSTPVPVSAPTANVGGPFDTSKQVNLQSAFGFTSAPWDHSAEFQSTNALRGAYWKNLLETMGV
jgi:hypothetical protein